MSDLPWFIKDPLRAIDRYITPSKYIVLDFETTNIEKGTPINDENFIVLAAWYVVEGDRVTKKYKFADQYGQTELEEDIRDADFIVAHNCFSGDTKFVTDEGVVSFESAVGKTVNVWNEQGWVPAAVKNYGKQRLKKITLVPYNRSSTSIKHTVRATPNHRWLVDRVFHTNKYGRVRKAVDGYVTTSDLRIGDKIHGALPSTEIDHMSDGFRHGLIFADGAKVTGREAYQIRLCGWKEKFKDCFNHYTYPPSADGDPVVNYYKSSVNLKDLPPADASPSYIAAFIEGWQLLDGTTSGKGGSRTIDTVDEVAADWLVENAIHAGWYVTGRSTHKLSSGYVKEMTLHKVVMTRDSSMGWTVTAIEDEDKEEDVFCVEVLNGVDRFTLDKGIYTANCKFELGWIRRMGTELRDILVYDTFLGEWVLGGNSLKPSALGLDATAARYGIGTKVALAGTMVKGGVCPTEIPKRWLLDYCFQDVELSYQLFKKQIVLLQERQLMHIVLVRNLTCAVLADIEFNSCELDPERVLKEYDATVAEYREIQEKLSAVAGGANLRSGAQLAKLLYETLGFSPPIDPKTRKPVKTATGRLSTNADTLKKLKVETQAQREFIELYTRQNTLAALLSKSLEFFKGVVTDYDAKFVGVFNQGFTGTHRLSSSGRPLSFKGKKKLSAAQLQNLPRIYKKLFWAEHADYLIGEADGAQLEFRIAAELSRDPVAIADIENGEDIHSHTAKVLTDAGEYGFREASPKDRRQMAKPQTFAPLFGSSGKTKATKAYAKFFREKYNSLFEEQTRWTREVLNTGKLRTSYGMIFYWPGTGMSSTGYIDNTTQIYNFPIQGYATAEIIPIALVHFWHRTRDLPIQVWNTVHDSIVSRIHKDYVSAYEEISKQCLTHDVYDFLRVVYNYDFVVPLGVGVKVGKHWGEGEEKVWSVWPDGRETLKQ